MDEPTAPAVTARRPGGRTQARAGDGHRPAAPACIPTGRSATPTSSTRAWSSPSRRRTAATRPARFVVCPWSCHHRGRVSCRARPPPALPHPEQRRGRASHREASLDALGAAPCCGAAMPSSEGADVDRRRTTSATWAPCWTSSASMAQWPTSAPGLERQLREVVGSMILKPQDPTTASHQPAQRDDRPFIESFFGQSPGRLSSAVDHNRQPSRPTTQRKPGGDGGGDSVPAQHAENCWTH